LNILFHETAFLGLSSELIIYHVSIILIKKRGARIILKGVKKDDFAVFSH
jgi:hypothetical protein